MARSEARIFTAVWKDKHFLALPKGAQWLYFFLVSQPDLTHCGVMPLRVRRWASKAEGLTEEEIRADLARLAEAKPNPFVVIDEESQELLVRSLMRRDKVLRQPFLFVPAAEAIENVESPAIQTALLAELRRALAEGDVNDKVVEQVKGLIHTLGERVQEWHSDTLSDTHSDTHAQTQADTQADTHGECHPETLPGIGGSYGPVVEGPPFPESPSGTPPASEPSARRDRDPIDDIAGLTLTQRSKRITDAYAEAEPMCNWPGINGIALKALKSNKYADSEIRDALLRLAKEGRTVTVETLRIELQGKPPRERDTPPPGSRNAQILSAAMERAVRAEQQRVHATIPRGEIPA